MESLDCYNDYFDPITPFGLVNYNWDVDGTDTSHDFNDQSQNYEESNTLSQTTNKILQLSEKLNHWSSKFVVKDGDKYIDVSSAARGASSVIPVGATHTNILYPGTKYQFHSRLFCQINNSESDVNVNDVEQIFFKMINSPETIDGCKMIRKRSNTNISCSRLCSHTYICSHGMIAKHDDSKFVPNHVGKCNVTVQHSKKHKSKGSLRGKRHFITKYLRTAFILLICFSCHFLLGVDKMSTKVGMKRLQCEMVGMQSNPSNEKCRKTVSYRAPSSEFKCPMQIIFFVGIDKNIYLSTRSNLKHEHHPRINANAILRGQRDLDTNDIDLITLLNEVNVSPTQIVNIMEQLKGQNGGTILPKRVYDLSQKVEDLQDFANGLLPECNDAQKTIIKLENSSINHFYILHDDTGLYAISKGRPSTETVRMRLVCPSSINDQLESMRKDFILNDMSQMLVMISMATDEMIQMVAMYPEVWFMDTTAGDIILYYVSIPLLRVFM